MLTVFTAANRRYEPFVVPYVASVLAHNPATVVEIALENPQHFRAEHARSLAVLDRFFPDLYAFSKGDFRRLPANSVRFIQIPLRRSEYVYIGDIDILVVQEIAPVHIANMERTGLTYSNIKRPGKTALSGLHFTRWEAYYPHAEAPKDRINLDEGYLYDLVVARGLPLPDPSDTFRPLHGYHLSLNRDPRMPKGMPKGMTWGGLGQRWAAQAFAKLRSTPLWLELAPHFDTRYKRVLFTLEVILATRFPDEMKATAPTPGLSLKTEW